MTIFMTLLLLSKNVEQKETLQEQDHFAKNL